MNLEGQQPSEGKLRGASYIDPADLILLSMSNQNGVDSHLFFNTATGKFMRIDFIEEIELHALVRLWDGEEPPASFPVLKRSIEDKTLETIGASIWNEFYRAEFGLSLLNRRRISEVVRYHSRLNLIAEIASVLALKTAAMIYLERRRAEGDETVQKMEWENSYKVPENLLPAFTQMRLGLLHWFSMQPEEADTTHREYWRTTVSYALTDLENQGIKLSGLTKNQVGKALNKHIFDNDDFEGEIHALSLCGRILANHVLIAVDFVNLSIRGMEGVLSLGKKVPRQKGPQLPLLVFEQEAILPFGEVEEQIRTNWQYPGESDLEILHGCQHQADLALPLKEVSDVIGSAIKWWREKQNELEEIREKLPSDPQGCHLYMQKIFQERRHSRRYLRSRYGLDMAHRRLLRKANQRLTAEDIARRAFYYGNAQALEAAAEAAHFTRCFHRDKLVEAGETLSERSLGGVIQQAAKAAVGVIEALPLFHCAIMERAKHPTVREVELYVLSGFAGTNISLRRYPRLRNAVTKKQMLEQLPEAISMAVNERRLGEPLIRGRNSLRNRVARFLESQNRPLSHKERPYSPDLLDRAGVESATYKRPEVAPEDFELFEEAKAKLDESIVQADLSPREQSIFELKLRGYSLRQIASELGITVGTVKQLRARAYKKIRSSLSKD